MKTRLLPALAVGAAVILGATGCTMISPQATTIPYAPSEGVNVPAASGPLEVRNALIVANDEGTKGNFLAGIVNPTDSSQTLTITFGEGGPTKTVRVPADGAVSLGFDDVDPIAVSGVDVTPGTVVSASFQSGDGDTTIVSVPVLDGKLDHLAPFVP